MSNDLTLRTTHSGGLSTSTSTAPDVGGDSDITQAQFTAKGLTYGHDMPTTFRTGVSTSTEVTIRRRGELSTARVRPPRSAAESAKDAKDAIASGVRQLDKPRRNNQRIVQRRIGWQATPSLIVVSVAERELEQSEPGKYRPTSSGWLMEHRSTYRNTDGRASKRVGKVPFETAGTDADTANSGETEPNLTQQKVRQAFPEGADALSYLPPAVRASVIGRVPAPTVFDGVVVQFSDPHTGAARRLQVDVLRMSSTTAVVVKATASPGGREWEVSQAVYSLDIPEVEQA